jgi:multiple sugar transport system substrate-binding protein
MNINKTKVAAAIAAVGVAGMLAACGGTGGNAVSPTPTETAATDAPATDAPATDSNCSVDAPCEITFRWWGNDGRAQMTQDAVDLFMEQNPDIKVNTEPGSFDGFFTGLGAEMAANTAPDLIQLNDSWPIEYGGRGGMVDLTTLGQWLDLAPFSDVALAPSTAAGGEVFGLPTGGNAVAIAADVTLFEQAGIELPDDESWTWDEMSALAVELTNALPDGTFGLAGLSGPAPIVRAFANQTDGGVFGTDGSITFSEAGLTEWFQMNLDFLNAGGVAPATLQSELAAAGAAETLLGQGLAAMQSVWSNQIGAFADANPNVADGGELVLLRMPSDNEAANVGTWLNPTLFYGITSSAQRAGDGNVEAAARLLDFLVNSEDAAKITGVDRGVPFNEAMAEVVLADLSPLEQSVVDYVARIAENSGPSIPMPQGGGAVFNLNVRFADEVMFGRMTPADAASQWLVEMQSALDAAQG